MDRLDAPAGNDAFVKQRKPLRRKTPLKQGAGLPRRNLPQPASRTCKTCGKKFSTARATSAGSTNGYCSRGCWNDAQRAKRAKRKAWCAVCRAPIDPGPPSKPVKTCGSKECVSEMKARAKRGERNPMRNPTVAARAGATRATTAEALVSDLLPPKRLTCARPGCENPVTRQSAYYCSPQCHYESRGNEPGRQHPSRRADFKDDVRQCRACPARGVHHHHVVYRQHVERAGGDRWHPDDALRLCLSCHSGHHGSKKLPLTVLRDENISFAFSLLGPSAYDYLMRYYVGTDPRVESALAEFTLPSPGSSDRVDG